MAGQELDRLSDPLASDEERQIRKRRLIKGPDRASSMQGTIDNEREQFDTDAIVG